MSVIRPATTDDLASIMTLEQSAHAYPWSEKIMQRYLLKPQAVWILEDDSRHVGHAVVSLVVDEAELLMITVDPKVQGKGYGTELLTAVMEKLQKAGASCMFLEVRESNAPAIALYEKLGFCENGRRRGYYPSEDGREDALLYSIELLD